MTPEDIQELHSLVQCPDSDSEDAEFLDSSSVSEQEDELRIPFASPLETHADDAVAGGNEELTSTPVSSLDHRDDQETGSAVQPADLGTSRASRREAKLKNRREGKGRRRICSRCSSENPGMSCKALLQSMLPDWEAIQKTPCENVRAIRSLQKKNPSTSSEQSRPVGRQNDFLMQFFDAHSMYTHCVEAIKEVFGVSAGRMSRLRERPRNLRSTTSMPASVAAQDWHLIPSVIIPDTFPAHRSKFLAKEIRDWLLSLGDAEGSVAQRPPGFLHKLAFRRSNRALPSFVIDDLIDFVKTNSSPNGRKFGFRGKRFVLFPNFKSIISSAKTPSPHQVSELPPSLVAYSVEDSLHSRLVSYICTRET